MDRTWPVDTNDTRTTSTSGKCRDLRRTAGFFKDTYLVRRGGSMGITWRLAILCIFLCALAMPALQAAGTALPHAQVSVAVNSLGLLDLVQIAAEGLAPTSQY